MLEDAAGIRRVVIACGYVDLRKGIDGLSMIIGKRSIASTFHHLCPSAIIVSYYTQSKKFSTRLF